MKEIVGFPPDVLEYLSTNDEETVYLDDMNDNSDESTAEIYIVTNEKNGTASLVVRPIYEAYQHLKESKGENKVFVSRQEVVHCFQLQMKNQNDEFMLHLSHTKSAWMQILSKGTNGYFVSSVTKLTKNTMFHIALQSVPRDTIKFRDDPLRYCKNFMHFIYNLLATDDERESTSDKETLADINELKIKTTDEKLINKFKVKFEYSDKNESSIFIAVCISAISALLAALVTWIYLIYKN